MDHYREMNKAFIRGWQTWNVRSVLSHVHMPDGLAVNLIFKEYASGAVLKESLIGRIGPNNKPSPSVEQALPGLHTFDGDYTQMTIRWQNVEMSVESTRDGDDLILLVTPASFQPKPLLLGAEVSYLWNREGAVRRQGESVLCQGPDGEREVRTTGTWLDDKNLPLQTPTLTVSLTGPVAVYTGKARTIDEAAALIERARAAAEKHGAEYGDLQGMYQAVECAMSWDTIYEPNKDRIISPVSRLWSIGSGGWVLFCWDNFFAGFMASLGCKELAYSNLIGILDEATDNGFVPNYAYATGQKSEDRSQPPVGSAMTLETYRKYREKWLIERMYPGLLRWNTWYTEHRQNPDGSMSWGSDPIPVLYGNYWETVGVNERFGGALESGLDNSPMYDDIPFDTERHMLCLADVGLTGLYILDCRSLIQLAREIGRDDDIPMLEARLKRAEAGLETMWDEEDGFYYNRRTDTGAFSKRISPTNFYALFSDSVPHERYRRIADGHYYNPDEFYGDWMIPSIARNDPAFKDQNYWRGRVWGPLNFLTYEALMRTDLQDVRADLSHKSLYMFRPEWDEKRHVHENYSAITGEGCDVVNSDRFYHWGALLALIALIEEGHMPGFGTDLN